MRNEPNLRIEPYRYVGDPRMSSPYGVNWGAFFVPGRFGTLKIISSGSADQNPLSEGWEHVSVSYTNTTPCWEDMDKVKKMFWADSETVIQFHPAEAQKKNEHQYCLHLWKKGGSEFELPPGIFV